MQRGCNYSDIISVANASHEPTIPATVGPDDTIVLPDKGILGGDIWRNFLPIVQIAQAEAPAAAVAFHEGDSRLGFSLD
jgi:hypothetical protein